MIQTKRCRSSLTPLSRPLVVLLTLAGSVSFVMTAHATDTTGPVVVFDSPTGQIDDLAGGIHGTAEDSDSGVATVKIRLVRNWTGANEWWNGNTNGAWVTNATDLPNTSVGTPNANGKVSWDTTATMPAGAQLLPGRYTLQAIVADAAGNSTTLNNVVGIKPTDALKPVTTITFPPADGQNYSRLTEFRGITTDPANAGVPGSGVTQVGVRLRRQKTGQTPQFWNGTTWVTNATQLPSMTELSWLRNTNLPGGSNLPVYDSNLPAADNWQYSILAYGIDRFNNIETPVARTFNIVPNTLPRPDAQSLNVPRNIARPITLTATDDEHDQITYRIVTPPAHGTLTGTEPNLSYLSVSNYNGPDSFTFVVKDWTNVESAPVTVTLNVVNDTTNPTAIISHPGVNERITGSMTAFDGTANDAGTGIASVGLQLFRDWNGTSYYWGPTGDPSIWSWSTTPNTVDAALGTAQANGDRSFSWPSNKPLPATDWPAGRYSARVFPRDYVNRTATYTNAFYRGQDATVPTGSIVPLNPVDAIPNLLDENGDSIFHGTASDSGGPAGENTLAKLQFRFLRNWTGANEYWNGSQWIATAADLPLTTTGPDGAGITSWQSLAEVNGVSVLPSGETDLPSGRYSAQIVITDTSANVTTLTSNILIIPLDTTAPSATVTFPANNAVLSRITEFRGTATDTIAGVPGSGVSRVLVRFKRQLKTGGTIEYWNGTAWVTSGINLNPISETSWVRNTNLPSLAQLATTPKTAQDYNYSVMAAPQDRYNNIGSFATNNFTVEPNTLPQAAPQSVTAIGRYGREGFATPVTLAATDGQNDPITAYKVVTQPEHGTLSGTAPNLTYISDAGYTGPDSFTFAASDWGGEGAASAVSINVVEPPPVDALIKNSSDLEYIGDDLVSADGTNETVSQQIFAGETAVYHGKLQKETALQSVALKVVGASAPAGWTVHYYDAYTNGLDITTAVTSPNGWPLSLMATEVNFRVEVTAPATLSAESEFAVLVAAGPSTTVITDAVKAVTTAKPAYQPDLSIRRLARDEDALDWENDAVKGSNVFNTTLTDIVPAQSRTWVTAKDWQENAAVTIRNTSGAPAHFRVQIPSVVGWDLGLYTSLEGGEDVAPAAQSFAGWITPELPAGGSLTLRAEAKATTLSPADLDFKIIATAGNYHDGVLMNLQAQSIAAVEWSTDKQNWQNVALVPVPGQEQYIVTHFRAIKARTGLAWPGNYGFQPQWQVFGQRRMGPDQSVQFRSYTPLNGTSQTVVAKCGNEVPVVVPVVPDVDLEVLAARGDALAGAGPTALTQIPITATALDENGFALAGYPVRFVAKDALNNVVGEFAGPGSMDDIAITDAQGKATILWTTGSSEAEVTIEAQVVNAQGAAMGEPDTTSIYQSRPYVLCEYGNWVQDAQENWSRTVTVYALHLGVKLQSYPFNLSPVVSEIEGQPMPGGATMAPLDLSTGTTNVQGQFQTVQHWVPTVPEDLPQDYQVDVTAAATG